MQTYEFDNGPVTLSRIDPTYMYIAVYKHIVSGGEITSPAHNLRLTGMYLQRTIAGHKKNIKRTVTINIRLLYVRSIWPSVTGPFGH